MSETPTPRTDDARLSIHERVRFARGDGVLYELVPATFARALERELTAERATLQSAQEELREDSAVRERMASLLSETAIALKGQEGKLQRHGWHDLPDIAGKIALACDISEAMLRDERAARKRAEAERDALAEALRPFAALLQSHHARRKDDQPIFGLNDQTITAGDLRRARAAIAELERGEGKEAAAGVQHDGCNYLAPVGHVCNKCGKVVRAAKEGS